MHWAKSSSFCSSSGERLALGLSPTTFARSGWQALSAACMASLSGPPAVPPAENPTENRPPPSSETSGSGMWRPWSGMHWAYARNASRAFVGAEADGDAPGLELAAGSSRLATLGAAAAPPQAAKSAAVARTNSVNRMVRDMGYLLVRD